MPKLTVQTFGGEVPRTGDTMLEQNDATMASNVRLYSGELRTWSGPVAQVAEIEAAAETIYRFENPSTEDTEWLSWAADVDVQRSSLDDTTDFRLYYTGDGTPKKTNWSMATTGVGPFPVDSYEMGVPAPTAAPTLAAAAGSSTAAETRYYVYTFVSTFGGITEESAPSPVSAAVTITTSQKVNLSAMQTAPVGDYNITHKRIYRTLAGEASDGAYVFVAQIAIATTTYSDDLLAAALGEPIETEGWTPPPAGLTGLVSMANGMMAGFVGNSVYFCEPYFHHAWPVEYMQSVPDQIVGLGSYGNSLIVMTKGQPYAMVGVSPDSISVEKIPMPEPCISKKSIATDEFGVLYASPNGLVGIGPTMRGVVTNKLFRRKEWREYSPDTMVGAIYDGKYFASFTSGIHGNNTMVISRDDHPALSFLSVRSNAFFYDLQDALLFYVDPSDNVVYRLDGDALNPYIYEWESKRFFFQQAVTWSVIRVDIDEDQINDNANYNDQAAAIIAANEAITGDILGSINETPLNHFTINGSELAEVPLPASAVSATVILYGERDEIKASFTITRLGAYRVPPFKSRELKIRLTGTLDIRSVTLATSFPELRG